MRQDIELHIATKDVAIAPSDNASFMDFGWVESSLNPDYLYGEIAIPSTVSESRVRERGVYIRIPYTPVYKEFVLRVRKGEGETASYLANPIIEGYGDLGAEGQNTWFFGIRMDKGAKAKASELEGYADGSFYVRFANGRAELYPSASLDFNVVPADRQNTNCLLACMPGNNYRYPLTGVGLVHWINSGHIASTGLADILQREFGGDGVSVKNAKYDYSTGRMSMDVETISD